MKTFILIFIFLKGTIAFAGAVSSGGTKLKKTEINPWWLENTDLVSYCVDSDASVFAVEHSRLQEIVQEGIGKWKDAFSLATDTFYKPGDLLPFDQLRVATQRFVEEPCSETTKLRFTFGKLSDKDKKLLDTPNEYVGVAVRTSYDMVNLRGQGFIYIAPLTGPDAPDAKDISPEAWSVCNNCLLRSVLWHELGHVFGIDHKPSGLMQEEIGYVSISRHVVQYYKSSPIPGMPNPETSLLEKMDPANAVINYRNMTSQGCMAGFPNINERFFKIPTDAQCRRIEFRSDAIDISYAMSPTTSYLTSGKIVWKHATDVEFPLIKVYLPQEQTVFSRSQSVARIGSDYIYGEQYRITMAHGFFVGEDEQPKPIYLRFLPWRIIETTGSNGQIVTPDLIKNF